MLGPTFNVLLAFFLFFFRHSLIPNAINGIDSLKERAYTRSRDDYLSAQLRSPLSLHYEIRLH